MVSTLLNIIQIGSFPQVGMKINNIWNHASDDIMVKHPSFLFQTTRIQFLLGVTPWNNYIFSPSKINSSLKNHGWKTVFFLKLSLFRGVIQAELIQVFVFCWCKRLKTHQATYPYPYPKTNQHHPNPHLICQSPRWIKLLNSTCSYWWYRQHWNGLP